MRQHRHLLSFACAMAMVAAPSLVSATGTPASQTEPRACTSHACLSTAFSHCQAASYRETRRLGSVRYTVIEPTTNGCKMSMTFTTNPNPAWVDQPLTFTLDNNKPLNGQLQAAVRACLTGNGAAAYHCGGPLHALLNGQQPADQEPTTSGS